MEHRLYFLERIRVRVSLILPAEPRPGEPTEGILVQLADGGAERLGLVLSMEAASELDARLRVALRAKELS